MTSSTVELDRLVPGIGEVLARFPEIAVAYVFGSMARGEAQPASDVDLGIVFRERRVRAADRHRMIGDLASRLESVTAPRPVDVVVLEDQGPVFCHDALLDGRMIYEADRDRRVDFESETIVRALDFRPTWNIAARGQVAGLRRWLRDERRTKEPTA